MPGLRTKALLISVGGSPEPVIYSINELKPECLCFFASAETRSIINNDILPKIVDRNVNGRNEEGKIKIVLKHSYLTD